MKATQSLAALVALSAVSLSAIGGTPPTIGGEANITANVQGAIANAGAGASGFQGTVKQAVASVLSGNVGGGLKLSVDVKGAIVNVGAGASGAKITACQSVGTIGSDCN